MALDQHLINLSQAVGADIKTLTANQGNLANLTTTAKNSLVTAINELKTLIGAGGGGVTMQDVTDAIAAAIDALVDGAPDALNTLKELADMLEGQDNAVAALVSAVAGKVSFADVQTLTTAQKLQACENIGIGDPETDFVAIYSTAKA